jgi:hypothetical protein
MVVDLPQPLEPRKPKISPRRMRKFTWSTATKSPKRMVRSAPRWRCRRRRCSGGITTAVAALLSSGSRAMKAASSVRAGARQQLGRRAGGQHRPSSMATSQSKRWASSM